MGSKSVPKKKLPVRKPKPQLTGGTTQPGQVKRLRGIHFVKIKGLNITSMHKELLDMTDVLMGREEPPINAGHLTLMEVADGFFARGSGMTMLIQAREREGLLTRNDPLYKFRTGELRTFMEMAKRAADLGSRRLTKEQLQFEMASFGRETRGHVP